MDNVVWSNPVDNSISIAFSSFFDKFPDTLKEIIIAFSSFGDNGIFYIIIGIFLLFFVKTRKIGFTFLFSCLFTLIVNDLIFKNIFSRARPFQDPELLTQLTSILNNNGQIYGITPSSPSFPSGHTFCAFYAFGGILSLCIFDKEEKKTYLAPLIFISIFSLIMGLTRILLSHHYFTDVLAGALIGTSIGLINYLLLKYLYKFNNYIYSKIKN